MSVNAAYANLNGSMVIINGRPPLKEIIATTDDYPKGWHEGNLGGLDAIDTDLATANIKNGITIFGKVGSADVQDISDATAIAAEVIEGETFYAVSGGIRTGTMPIVALAAGANAYPAGYHAGAASLTAVDGDLVTGSIRQGVTIFGVAGAATVQDIADADAGVGDVLNPRTFYSVTGARKTGTMPTVAVAPGSSAYPAGYHAGDAGGLPAIDADLATGNIKSGITIFGIAGHDNVRDISDADLVEAEAPTGKTFYAVSGGRRTGTGTKTLSPANETVAAGYYAATTLSTVDGDLAPENIKQGVTIFGKVGTYVGVDVSDADALVTDVKAGKTFYSVAAPRKTGTLPTVAIVAANDNYPAGYHAGNAGGLDAIDTDLAPANIKKDVNIFGKVGTLLDLDYALAQGWLDELKATVADFQANSATGTLNNVTYLNNNNTTDTASHANVGTYGEVDFGKHVYIKRWRQFGNDSNNGDGEWKIQYWNLVSESWEDWVTGIPNRALETWSDYVTETAKLTTKIRFTIVTTDSSGVSRVNELEVIY